MTSLFDRATSCLKALPASSLPAHAPEAHDGTDVAAAYKQGLKTAHTLQGSDLCDLLGVNPCQGLSKTVANARLDKYGLNELAPLQSTLLGLQSWSQKRYSRPALVLREGRFAEVKAEHLVVGDIIYVEQGQDLPADVRILYAQPTETPTYSLDSQGAWLESRKPSPPVLDAFVPCNIPPFAAQHDVSPSQAFDKANNMGFRGASVVQGSLIGAVTAVGHQCLISKLKVSPLKDGQPPRVTQRVDKKKLQKVALKVESLGLRVKHFETYQPLCGMRNVTVIISVSQSIAAELNPALTKLVMQGFRIILAFCGDAKSDVVRQLPNPAIGSPIDLDRVYDFSVTAAINEFVAHAATESAMLTVATSETIKDVVIAASEHFNNEPVVLFSDRIEDAPALTRATLGVCSWLAPATVLQSAHAIAGPKGLERLALFLKVLKESTEILG